MTSPYEDGQDPVDDDRLQDITPADELVHRSGSNVSETTDDQLSSPAPTNALPDGRPSDVSRRRPPSSPRPPEKRQAQSEELEDRVLPDELIQRLPDPPPALVVLISIGFTAVSSLVVFGAVLEIFPVSMVWTILPIWVALMAGVNWYYFRRHGGGPTEGR